MATEYRQFVLKIFLFQFVFGYVFAIAGVALSIYLYFEFRDVGVPIAGSKERANPLILSLVSSLISIIFGLSASYVVKPYIRRLRAEQESKESNSGDHV